MPQEIKEALAQVTKEDDRAVREALLAHADLPLKKNQLSAGQWLHFIPVLARVMPAFWFGVIIGIWGSTKVIGST